MPGLQEGDIITAVDSTKISSMTELQSALKSYKAGDKVTLTVAVRVADSTKRARLK